MSEGIVNNNPKKELLFALGGIALFLSIVLLIGVSAFLRPAGQHIVVQTPEELAAADEAAATAATAPVEDAAPAETDAAADTTVTPATDSEDSAATDSAVVTAEAGTATTSGTVSQAAVEDADLTAEQADGDLEAGDVAKTEAAQ